MAEIRVDVKSDSRELDTTDKKLNRFRESVERAGRIIDVDFTEKINRAASSMKDLSARLQKMTGALLSMLFFGMLLQNTFTSALKSIFEGYSKANDEGNAFNQLTTRLSANWAYFKYQLAQTLAESPIFQSLIDSVIMLIQWFQKLPEPVKGFIVVMMGVLAVFGFMLFMLGQLGLGLYGLIELAGILGISMSGAMLPIIATIGAILLLFGLLAVLFSVNSGHLENLGLEVDGFWNNVWSIMVTFVAGIVNIFILLLSAIIGIFILIGSVIVGVFDVVIATIYNSFKKLFTAVWDGFLALVSGENFADAFIEGWNSVDVGGAIVDSIDRSIQRGQDAISGLSTIATGATSFVNELEYEAQKSLSTTPNGTAENNNTTVNNFYTLDEAVSQGVITQEQAIIARNNGYLG